LILLATEDTEGTENCKTEKGEWKSVGESATNHGIHVFQTIPVSPLAFFLCDLCDLKEYSDVPGT